MAAVTGNIPDILMALGLESQERVYCQIVVGRISALNCLQSQGQEGCFACNAASRLCELCATRQVAIAETGMCSVCLTQELKKEQGSKMPEFPLGHRIYCIIPTVKKEINVTTCAKMQGTEECRGCNVPSRACEGCRIRPSRFPRAGLCLTCIVKEFGDDWQPLSDTAMKAVISAESSLAEQSVGTAALTADRADARITGEETAGLAAEEDDEDPWRTEIPDQFGVSAGHSEMREDTHQADTGERSIGFRKKTRSAAFLSASKTREARPGWTSTPVPSTEKIRAVDPALLKSARDVIFRTRHASQLFLQGEMKISQTLAKQIMVALEAEGTVGPYRGGNSTREILKNEVAEVHPTGAVDIQRAIEFARLHKSIWPKHLQEAMGITKRTARTLVHELEQRGIVGSATSHGHKVLVPHPQNTDTTPAPATRPRADTDGEPPDPLLVAKARDLVTRYRRADYEFLSNHLHVTNRVIKKILDALAREGVVGATSHGHHRKVLAAASEAADMLYSLQEQANGIMRLLAIIGEDSAFGQLLRAVAYTVQEHEALLPYREAILQMKEVMDKIRT